MALVRGIRGATTAEDNTREAILRATKELLERLVDDNGITPDDVAAAFFTATEDLNAEFPRWRPIRWVGGTSPSWTATK